jgi:hypothetical protein
VQGQPNTQWRVSPAGRDGLPAGPAAIVALDSLVIPRDMNWRSGGDLLPDRVVAMREHFQSVMAGHAQFV